MTKGDAADCKATYLLRVIERWGLGDETVVSLRDWASLRRSHPEQLKEALRVYARSIAPVALSKRQRRPAGLSPADWLISLKPEYANSAVARWEGRHKSSVLTLLAELYAICPEIVLNNPWGHDMLIGQPGLLDTVMTGGAWAIEIVSATPILSSDGLDRQASMIGGIPWACERYPWPCGRDGMMSPIVQLNLGELGLSLVHDFPPILLQIWGDGMDLHTRVIALESIDQTVALNEVPYCKNEYLHYMSSENKLIGETIHIGRAHFDVLPNGVMAKFTDFHIPDHYLASMTPHRLAIVDRILSELFAETERLDAALPGFVRRNHFGGWQSPIQSFYDPWNGSRALLEYHSIWYGKGLYVFLNGSMQITFDPNDLSDGYIAYASR